MTSSHLNLFVTSVQSSLTFSNISYISSYPTAAAVLHEQLTEALFLVETRNAHSIGPFFNHHEVLQQL